MPGNLFPAWVQLLMPDVAIPCTKNFWVNMKKMMTGKGK